MKRALRILCAAVLGLGIAAFAADSAPPSSARSDAKGSLAERYRPAAERIIGAVMAGNDAYRKLEALCDGIGHRLSGSPQLDKAIEWAIQTMKKDGQENVRAEPVTVPRWVRGRESLVMTAPREESLVVLGLGGSVGTPPEGISAEVLSVRNEEELEALGERARGKIILFDNPMPAYTLEGGTHYGTTVRFRSKGASLAAKQGAVACLIRSVTATSLRSPHTGALRYEDGIPKIPAAAVSIEDAAMLTRLTARRIPVRVTLKMEAKMLDPVPSANVVGELRGTAWPDEVVVISGHLDSWDVGQGAHDDGGGCVMAMESINVLRKLNLVPKRTIRVVLWTNEENGLAGGKQYAKDHAEELANHIAAIEADSGAFRPKGYSLECSDSSRADAAVEQMRDILSLFESFGPMTVRTGGSGADISAMKSAGVLLMGHEADMAKYFDYHHSPADTLDKVDPHELSQNVAVMATVAYILADMPERIGGPPPAAHSR
jgi:Zn-dependent M28 family amino/carboxypeptidase